MPAAFDCRSKAKYLHPPCARKTSATQGNLISGSGNFCRWGLFLAEFSVLCHLFITKKLSTFHTRVTFFIKIYLNSKIIRIRKPQQRRCRKMVYVETYADPQTLHLQFLAFYISFISIIEGRALFTLYLLSYM